MRLVSFDGGWGWLSPDGGGLREAEWPASVAELVALPAAERPAAFRRWRHEHELAALRLRAPITPRRNPFAVGVNYRDHAAEATTAPPDRPVFFSKATTTVTGPGPVTVDPALTSRVDWEVELAVVLGTGGRDLTPSQAQAAIYGYLVANDLSARDQQHDRPEGQWFLGKSLDGFCPLGPWLATTDEITDPQALDLRLSVNGVAKQQASTKDMVFPVADLLAELSRFVTLLPGDILLTGTPGGVGDARTPPEYLADGDLVVAEATGLGTLHTQIVHRGRP